MSGKHSTKKSNKLAIIAVAAVVVVIAVICVIIFVFAGNNSNNATPSTATTTQPVSSTQTEEITTTKAASDEPTTAQITTTTAAEETTEPEDDHDEPNTQVVVVPTESGEEISYFSGTYSPYMAVDASTGNECSFKEVFGSSYMGGSFVFNSDGTFSDSLSQTSSNSGAYAVNGDSIIATYTNDKNVTISVTEWNGDTPSEFIINYGGYNVYFS